jgi:hypothetical protein
MRDEDVPHPLTEVNMNTHFRPTLQAGLTLALASVGPLIFPAAQAGYGTMAALSTWLLLPSIVLLALVVAWTWQRTPKLARATVAGAVAGPLATLALEVVRLLGFRLGFMPGSLPRLMGVLILDRFAMGPSLTSDIVGFAYHFWNGASFGILYVLVLGASRRWVGILFGIAVGLGFLVSPVVVSLGVGYFGLQFSVAFPVTVLLAHVAFGAALGMLAHRFSAGQPSALFAALRIPTASPSTDRGNVISEA